MRYKEIERDLVGYFLAAVVAGILVGAAVRHSYHLLKL